MRSILLVVGVFSVAQTAAAQTVAVKNSEPAMPDSAYLALTLELPVHGTFFVTRHAMRRPAGTGSHSNEQVRDFFYLDRVEIAGCRMTYFQRNGGSPATATKVDVPLKQIDPQSVQVRQLRGATLELPPWEINVKAIDRSERPFAFSRRGYATVRNLNEISIPIVDRDRADRYAALLKDAAARCDSWNTSPMAPIR